MPNGHSGRRVAIEALDPVTGGVCHVFLSHRRLQNVGGRGMAHALEVCRIVPGILRAPSAVFEGLLRDEDEDRDPGSPPGWRCYCGIPLHSFRQDGSQHRPYPNQVYTVFVNHDNVAYNWRWERSAEDNIALPENHAIRFRRRLEWLQ